MISIRLRLLYRRLSYLTGFVCVFRPGLHGLTPLSCKALRNQSASNPRSPSSHCALRWEAYRAELPSRHEKANRTVLCIGDGMKLGVHAAFRAANQAHRAISDHCDRRKQYRSKPAGHLREVAHGSWEVGMKPSHLLVRQPV